MIEPTPTRQPNYFRDVPNAFQPRAGEWLVVSLHHIFGSEELSAHAPGIAQLAPKPYVALNPQDAAKLNLSDGTALELTFAGASRQLPAKIMPALPVGVIGLPVGLPGMSFVTLPAFGKISK